MTPSHERKLQRAIRYLRAEFTTRRWHNIYVLDSHVKGTNRTGLRPCLFKYQPSTQPEPKMIEIIPRIPCKMKYCDEDVSVHVCTYTDNGRLCIQTYTLDESREPMATITVNLPHVSLPPDVILIKDYSENEGAAAWAIEAKIVEPKACGAFQSGFVWIKAFRLTPEFIQLLKDAGFWDEYIKEFDGKPSLD